MYAFTWNDDNYAGLDSFDELKQTATYGDKARADSIMLIVLDEVSKKMSVVAINRDTMTEVHRFSRNGDDLGVYVTHLGYAYTFAVVFAKISLLYSVLFMTHCEIFIFFFRSKQRIHTLDLKIHLPELC